MALDDALADGQPNSVAGYLLVGMKPAEDHKDTFVKLGIDSYIVVRYDADSFIAFPASASGNHLAVGAGGARSTSPSSSTQRLILGCGISGCANR